LSIRLLSRDFAFYGLLDFLQRSLTIILVPIYTRVLTRTNYGNLDLVLTVCSALTVLVDLQFAAGFSRLYLQHQRTGQGPRFAGTAILTRVLLGTAVVALFVSLGFAGFLELRFIPSFLAHRAAWTIACLSIPVTFVFDLLLVQAQMLRRKKWFFAGAFGNTLLSSVLCVVFTVVFRLGILGVVLGQQVALVVATSILFFGLRHDVSFRYHRQLVAELARYTLPLVPGRWVGHFSAYVSRFFVYGALGAGENAILAITTKLAAVIGLFCVAFRTAWQPLAMAYIGDEAGEAFYVRSLRLFMAGGLFTVFWLTALSKPILAILAPASYSEAEYYVPWFLVASIIGELDVNLQLGNQISKKTYWISVSSALAFTVNVLILIALTPRLGIYAAAIGLLLAFLAKVSITYFSAQHHYRIPYDKRSLFIFALGCLTLLALSFGRRINLVGNPAFFCSVLLFGTALPWLTLAAFERQLFKNLIDQSLTRFINARRARYS
jgi:O-antigen/teichoic acid export membrane protein